LKFLSQKRQPTTKNQEHQTSRHIMVLSWTRRAVTSSNILIIALASSLPRGALSFILTTTKLAFPRYSTTTLLKRTPFAFISQQEAQLRPNGPFMTKLAIAPSANTNAATTTTATTSNSNKHDVLLLYGGDYAGLSATFDVWSGKLIAVPDDLVPEALLEWGQAPSALEVLVSEDFNIIDKKDDHSSNNSNSNSPAAKLLDYSFQRQTVAIMPAVGCGVDNLQVEKGPVEEVSFVIPQRDHHIHDKSENHESSLEVVAAGGAALMGIATCTRHGNSLQQQHFMEATFAWPTAEQNNRHRVRVMIPFTLTAMPVLAADAAAADSNEATATALPPIQLQSPIRVILERQFEATSSRGTRANGGGLDGRSITQWLGPWLHSSAARNFAEAAIPNEETIATTAAVATSISLPGNITISHGFNHGEGSFGEMADSSSNTRFWFLEIAHMPADQNTRSVARQTFPLSSNIMPLTAWTLKDIHAKSTVEYSVQ
jgi:hypothetical protein